MMKLRIASATNCATNRKVWHQYREGFNLLLRKFGFYLFVRNKVSQIACWISSIALLTHPYKVVRTIGENLPVE